MPWLPPGKDVIHDAGALRVREELRPEADQAARGDAELEPHASASVIHHFCRHAASSPRLRDDHTLELLGHVDHEVFDRFHLHAVDFLRDDFRARDLQLVPFAPHHLDQNRQLQLASPDHLHLFRRIRVLHAQRDIAEELLRQPLAQVARGDVLAVAPRHWRGVHAEDHRDGRLVHGDRRNRDRLFDRCDRFADRDVLDPRQADDVAGHRALDLDPFQPVERKELRDLGLLGSAAQFQHRDRVIQIHRAVEDAPNRDAPQVVARIEVRDEDLQRRLRVAARRRHMVDDRLEERLQVLAA